MVDNETKARNMAQLFLEAWGVHLSELDEDDMYSWFLAAMRD